MAMRSPRDLFVHELGDVFSAEHVFLSAMRDMQSRCQNQQLKQGLERHIQETQHQISNLEQCFSSLGQPARQTGCPGAEGIVREYQSGLSSIQSPDVLDLFILGSASRGEHYEIAAYTELIQSARALGDQRCIPLLEESLRQEQRFAHEVEQLHSQLGQTAAARQPSP